MAGALLGLLGKESVEWPTHSEGAGDAVVRPRLCGGGGNLRDSPCSLTLMYENLQGVAKKYVPWLLRGDAFILEPSSTVRNI